MTFIAATGNPGKLKEFVRILTPLGHQVLSQKEANVHCSPEETGHTFEENARIKARAVCDATNMPVIADDSGLCVDALDGAPGIYSARYAEKNATDRDRINKLLSALREVPEGKRTAHFVSVICCIFPDGREIVARGECEGTIAFAQDGVDGFGYDPIFVEKSTGKTFANLSASEKDAVSHRGKSMRAFATDLIKMKK
ncbi:MAG TPA: non-canonical purine NTP pyrophosphatase, RdgB/HAM1 family [Ruminococcaceae bacterium]|nr:non-canonical purine NTP pyrophosphatase, RdgB/HAM1 family [Oscillospiraceae bacterium]